LKDPNAFNIDDKLEIDSEFNNTNNFFNSKSLQHTQELSLEKMYYPEELSDSRKKILQYNQKESEPQLNLDKGDIRLQMALISDRSEYESDLDEPINTPSKLESNKNVILKSQTKDPLPLENSSKYEPFRDSLKPEMK